VFSPRIIVDKPFAGSSCSTRRGDETNLLPSRSLAFEQRRGRCYGIDTQTEQPLSLDEALCWCCSAGTWNQLLRKELKGTPPPMGGGAFGLETFVVEDTPVFAAFGQTEAPESPTFQEGFRSVKAAYNEDIPPTVSIIIPVYNNLHFTKACLESIFAQTPVGNF